MSAFQLSKEHIDWASRRKQGLSPSVLRELIAKQAGRCALSGAEMVFEKKKGTPEAGGCGCHPLYAAIDHVAPKSQDHGWQIVCYDLNDLKGHLPPPLFSALAATTAWREFVAAWKAQSESDPSDAAAFKALIQKGKGNEPKWSSEREPAVQFKMVQRTGASRSVQETNRTSSAAGSRR